MYIYYNIYVIIYLPLVPLFFKSSLFCGYIKICCIQQLLYICMLYVFMHNYVTSYIICVPQCWHTCAFSIVYMYRVSVYVWEFKIFKLDNDKTGQLWVTRLIQHSAKTLHRTGTPRLTLARVRPIFCI